MAELYRAHARRLEQIVRTDLRMPDADVEDACQFAWVMLVAHAHRIRREAALTWLVTTAVREAMRRARYGAREASWDAGLDAIDPKALSPQQLFEQRERLRDVRALPERQQRMIWLHALGLTYGEISLHTGCTLRTVERQLLRAKRTLREVHRGQ